MTQQQGPIKAIIGLGNPGTAYAKTRHNIGFCVLDQLCDLFMGTWRSTPIALEATITLNNCPLILIKPQTYMNSSGKVIPGLKKKGIEAHNILVVHDELQLPFGTVKYRFGGSARGHNGLRSIIAAYGQDFGRIACGIDRPENKDDVPAYVLRSFNEPPQAVEHMIDTAVRTIEDVVVKNYSS